MGLATEQSKLRLVKRPGIRCLKLAKVVKSCSIVSQMLVSNFMRAFAVKPTEVKERYTVTTDKLAVEKNCIEIQAMTFQESIAVALLIEVWRCLRRQSCFVS